MHLGTVSVTASDLVTHCRGCIQQYSIRLVTALQQVFTDLNMSSQLSDAVDLAK